MKKFENFDKINEESEVSNEISISVGGKKYKWKVENGRDLQTAIGSDYLTNFTFSFPNGNKIKATKI
jgi:hypothetical protein